MAKGFKGTVTVKLQTPVQWEGNDVSELDLNFGKLTPTAVIEAERNCGANLTSIMKMTNVEYCSNIASYSMQWERNIAYRILMKLEMDDFDTVWQTVGAFIGKRNPQEFYDQFTAEEVEYEVGFTKPAAPTGERLIEQKPETEE